MGNKKNIYEDIDRVKLLIMYDLSKTSEENLFNLKEQTEDAFKNEWFRLQSTPPRSFKITDYPPCVRKFGEPREERQYNMSPVIFGTGEYQGYKFESGGNNPTVTKRDDITDNYYCDRNDNIRFGRPNYSELKLPTFDNYGDPKEPPNLYTKPTVKTKSPYPEDFNVELKSQPTTVKFFGGRGFIWSVVNRDKNRNLKIENVQLSGDKKFIVESFFTGNIPPDHYADIKIWVNPTWHDETMEKDLKLTITTNFGQIISTVRSGEVIFENKYKKQQRELMDRTKERKSPTLAIDVPKYFSPFSYEEFLGELKKLLLKCPNFKKDYLKYFGTEKNFQKVEVPNDSYSYDGNWGTGISYGASGTYSSEYRNINGNNEFRTCYDDITNLISKYYDKRFPTGITPEDKKNFEAEIRSIDKELETLSKKSPRYDELVKRKDELKIEYAYDTRNWFDHFWEDYGLYIQIGLGVVALVASAGWAAPALVATYGMTAAEATAALASTSRWAVLLDFYMNVGVGTYQLAKGDTKEAIVSFFFAALPKIHKLYSKVGQIWGETSVEVTKSLAEKISKVSLQNAAERNAFLYSLKGEEKEIFKKITKLNKEDWKTIGNLVQEDIEKQMKIKSTAKQITQGIGNLAVTGAIDFAAIKTAQQLYEKLVGFINRYCKDCLKTEEEKMAAKTYLMSLSPNQVKNVISIAKILSDEAAPEIVAQKLEPVVLGKSMVKVVKEETKVIDENKLREKMRQEGLIP